MTLNSRVRTIIFYIFMVCGVTALGLIIYVKALHKESNVKGKTVSKTNPVEANVTMVGGNCFLAYWETEEESIGYVKYGSSPDTINLVGKNKEGFIYSTRHEIKVCDLTEPEYYVIIVSDGVPYGLNGVPIKVQRE
ncbi:hypothetical protein JW962_03670 [Candidatus Dojkabacteria bacterium]|nr:hypothetical protein [Candidatus Dojkabacteria bacterium]